MTDCSAAGAHELAGGKNSLKNRCAFSKVQTGTGECADPNQNIERSVLGFSVIYIGEAGTRC